MRWGEGEGDQFNINIDTHSIDKVQAVSEGKRVRK